MARLFTRLATAAACAAALSLAATPAMARGWHGPRHYNHGGVDGGDILAGALILGGIAAIASAASNSNNRDRGTDYRYDEPAPYSGSGATYQNRSSSYSGGGIDNAVNMCVNEVERGRDRVSAVDNAARTTDGWKISGQLNAGSGFSCWIDNDGRIRNVDVGGQAYDDRSYDDRSYDSGSGDAGTAYDGSGPDNRPVWNGADAEQPATGQWDDDSYARAREQVGYAQN